MKNVLNGFLVTAIAFVFGIVAVHSIIERTTLEEISANTSTYDGRWVEFETYAQLGVDNSISLGEPYEKYEKFTYVESSSDLSLFRSILGTNLSRKEYNRVKVIARGRVQDNCAYRLCCFGESITLLNAEIVPIGNAEPYHLPFDTPTSHSQ